MSPHYGMQFWYSSPQMKIIHREISPKQIEADLFMGNFGCLQKQYGRPVEHKSLLVVWVDWGGVVLVIDYNDIRKERCDKFDLLGWDFLSQKSLRAILVTNI